MTFGNAEHHHLSTLKKLKKTKKNRENRKHSKKERWKHSELSL